MGSVIKDFYKSDAPQFKGRSKEKRREMAIAAKLEAERGPQNEAVARDKEGNDKFDRYKRMVRHKQDKYGPSTLKQRLTHGGVDHNIDNERKAKMKNEGMSPKEIMLQKKKAMIDQKIARDRKKQLNKAEPAEPTKAMGEGLSVDDQMKISRDAAKGRNPNPDHKAIRGKMLRKPLPKDTRTDAEKMTAAVGKPRMGSSD